MTYMEFKCRPNVEYVLRYSILYHLNMPELSDKNIKHVLNDRENVNVITISLTISELLVRYIQQYQWLLRSTDQFF